MAGEVQSGVTGENHRLLSRIYLHTSLSIYCNINRSRTTHANKKQRRKCKNAGEVPRGAIRSYRENHRLPPLIISGLVQQYIIIPKLTRYIYFDIIRILSVYDVLVLV